MTRSPVNLRNLEQIHETSRTASPKLATFVLGAFGLSAVVASGVLLRDHGGEEAQVSKDPLAELLSQENSQASKNGGEVSAEDLDFPDLLSDSDRRTTALVAVRDREEGAEQTEAEPDAPPAPVDELPSEPRPAGSLLNATPVTTAPKDDLTKLAVEAAQVPADVEPAGPGQAGGFQVQVASFKDQAEAERFALELRGRGHQAHRVAANVPGRGLWHRVRIGPFKSKYQASLYKTKLEESEHITALVIDPDKVERQQQVRAAKLAERIRKYGAP
jgi:cell division septation protein DedD